MKPLITTLLPQQGFQELLPLSLGYNRKLEKHSRLIAKENRRAEAVAENNRRRERERKREEAEFIRQQKQVASKLIINKQKGTVVCIKCKGTGKEPEYRVSYSYQTYNEDLRQCRWCKGTGTIKLKVPKVSI